MFTFTRPVVPPAALRVAILNTDTPALSVEQTRGSYGNIFHEKLQRVAGHVQPGLRILSQDFDAVNEELPSSDQIGTFDVLMISGSHFSAYDDLLWIKNLETLIRNVYDEHPSVRLYGSCFGHQIIAQSLLGRVGSAVVEPNPSGWEVGVQEIKFVPEFRQNFPQRHLDSTTRPPTPPKSPLGERRNSNTLRIQLIHADHVKLSTTKALPGNWMLVGKSTKCANQGMYEPGRVLTFQGHFEFDSFINYETVKMFGSGWPSEDMQRRLESTKHEDDSDEIAEMILQFMLRMDGPSNDPAAISGSATPPEFEPSRGWVN